MGAAKHVIGFFFIQVQAFFFYYVYGNSKGKLSSVQLVNSKYYNFKLSTDWPFLYVCVCVCYLLRPHITLIKINNESS